MAEPPSDARTLLEIAVRCLDLTSLEGDEAPERVHEICERAMRPDDASDAVPSVAAVVLYPQFVSMAAEHLRGSGVKVATVVGFPAPTEPLPKRLAEIHAAIDAGADEIDVVLDREALARDRDRASEEIARAREAGEGAPLKVILETGELGEAARIQDAATLAMEAGADFVKSSTGKVGMGATPEGALAMMEAVRDFHGRTGRPVGVKISGGVRKPEQALEYMKLLERTLGSEWLSPERFRIGASSLLGELVARLRAERGD